jgi:hypothetical protein
LVESLFNEEPRGVEMGGKEESGSSTVGLSPLGS